MSRVKTTSRYKTVQEFQDHLRTPCQRELSIQRGERDKFSNGDYIKNKKSLREDQIDEVKGVVGLDMGSATMASASLLREKSRRPSKFVRLNKKWCGSKSGLTRGYVDNHCGTRLFRKWIDKSKKLDGDVLIAERAISTVSSRKCLDLRDLESALLVQFRHLRTMKRFYRSKSFCRQRLLLKSRHRRFVDTMARKLVMVAEKHTHKKSKVTFAIGNCIDHPCYRGHRGGRLPNSKLVKALSRIRRVVLIDEYNTTKRYVQKNSLILLKHIFISNTTITSISCFFCKSSSVYQHWNLRRGVRKSVGYGRRFKMFNPRGAKLMGYRSKGFNAVTRTPVRGASHCSTCRRRYNRDINAACNIAYVLKVFIRDGISRPAYLSRA